MKELISFILFIASIGFVEDFLKFLFEEQYQVIYKYICFFALVIIYIIYFFFYSKIELLYAQKFGFSEIHKEWFPSETSKIAKYNHYIMGKLISESTKVRLVSVTGDWDLVKTFSDSELEAFFGQNNKEIKVVLCHPSLSYLNEHANNEDKQHTTRLIHKIISNTIKLKSFGVNVRWTLHQPIFHFVGGDSEIHFGYYPKGKKGHASHRYIVSRDKPLYRSLDIWFDELWKNSEIPCNVTELEDKEKFLEPTKAVFVDRDDTLIKDLGYSAIENKEDVIILDGVIDGLKLLIEDGYKIFIISNQQAVGLGIIQKNLFYIQNKIIKDCFASHGVLFDKMYFCLHTEAMKCNCRKPKPDLFFKAQKEFNIDFKESFFIGDSESDMEVKKYLPELKIYKVSKSKNFLEIAGDILKLKINSP